METQKAKAKVEEKEETEAEAKETAPTHTLKRAVGTSKAKAEARETHAPRHNSMKHGERSQTCGQMNTSSCCMQT